MSKETEERAARDLEVIQKVLDGDTEAFGELVTQYQRLAASVAWRYGTPAAEVEDVVSEIFIRAFSNLRQYRPEYPFSTWLYRLAANRVVDIGRSKRRERGRSEMPEQITDTSPGPGEEQETDERAQLVRAALSELPDHYREVLFLVYVEGMKVDEAAHNLGLPQGTIKTRLMRGRAAMKKVLARRHPEHFGG
jgi:RNA polymerase sigma-70 factor (ECF subfamily)